MAKKGSIKFIPRSRDEEVLNWLHMRDDLGMTCADIARQQGIKHHQTIGKTLRDIDRASEEAE